MELAVLDKTGKDTGRKVALSDSVFGIEPNEHTVYLDVKQYLANQRQGTHKSKERNEVVGSTKKLKKQKGSGAARYGDVKSPIFRGGGRIFGPKPRYYGFKLNKKVKAVAKKSVLSSSLKEDKLIVLEDLKFDAPKTKDFVAVLKGLDLEGKRVTLITTENEKNVYLSSKNVQKVKVVATSEVNTYDLINCSKLVLSESSVKEIENILS
ncbi:MAG: 50S ribosomal protein L4 [Flavobacteriales bacterium]|nr:50S ribosomal protein L4 [Flavobacteriales bacterium]|tara:strand:+ start:477 stop:1103 length:627 start_codon:yes stop_codon:yes gene_type:complete